MPEEEVIRRAERDKEEGKSASTQAGEFVREEMDHIREGKHGARSPQQAIAIGLSKARRAGVDLPPKPGLSADTRKQAERDLRKGKSSRRGSASRRQAALKASRTRRRTRSRRAGRA